MRNSQPDSRYVLFMTHTIFYHRTIRNIKNGFKIKKSEVKNMWERFKFWMMGYKDCAGCCLGCSFFEECKADVFSEMNEQEAYERDVCIDAIIKERMPDRYNKTA